MDTLGNPMIYQHWYSSEHYNEPDNSGGNQHCAFLNFLEDGKWGDAPCMFQLQCYACQTGGNYCQDGWVKVGQSCVQVRVSITYTVAL